MIKKPVSKQCDICGELIWASYDYCENCCGHDDTDGFECLICGGDLREDIMSQAFDKYKDRMKYGE